LLTPEVLRMMGCSGAAPIRPEQVALIDRLIDECRHLVRARAAYVIRAVVRMTDTRLDLRGCPSIYGPIAGFLQAATRVIVFVVTIGEEIERLATERMRAGQRLEGYTLDAIGSVATDAAADAFADHIQMNEAQPCEAITLPFSPGYCGMSLDEQQTLFSVVDARPIGVELLPTLIMRPIKSVSGLLGIGQREAVETHGVPCQWCSLEHCRMRRPQ